MKPNASSYTASISMPEDRKALLSRMVLSVSGWRLCFGDTVDSLGPVIDPAQRDITGLAGFVFSDFLRDVTGKQTPVVTVGTDTRPTGPAIADTIMRAFVTAGLSIQWLGPVASPEIMAYTKAIAGVDAFFYITASHNPPGYNGFKFGLSDGSVLSGDHAQILIETFRKLIDDTEASDDRIRKLAAVEPHAMKEIERGRHSFKKESYRVYRNFILQVASSVPATTTEHDLEQEFLVPLRRSLTGAPIGIVGELNGSARTTSIDRGLLPYLGVRSAFHNDRPGRFKHQILPEGAGLSDAATLLREYYRQDAAFQVAYVPDNDGDRGNLIFMDRTGEPVLLEAQQVFALTVLVELAWLRYRGESSDRVCVVANGPTSLRVDRIAHRFGAEVFRAEVGEANVVALARRLSGDRWKVPILGEGSNGGNIVPPATVRDPMSTLLAMLKLHAFRLTEIIENVLGPPDREDHGDTRISASETPMLLDTVRMLPVFTTTGTDDPPAKMQVGPVSHRALKQRYEQLVTHRVKEILDPLSRELNVSDWELWNYEGTRAFRGPGNRTGSESGGLRLVFIDPEKQPRASVWMRGSGTEPVYRVLADCEGDNGPLADRLIRWQRRIVQEAVDSITE